MRSDYDPDGEPYDVPAWRLLRRLRLAEQRAGHAERHAAELERALRIVCDTMSPDPDGGRPHLFSVPERPSKG